MADPRAVPPEERERRIAELRARRRQRLRVLAWRSAFFAVGIALLVAVLLSWLLTTVGGRDVLLRQIVQRLPAGATLTWDSATGPAAGPMTLRGVRFTLPRQRDPDCVPGDGATCEMGTLVFTADTLVVDPALRPLLGRRLRLDALVVQDATLDLPRSDTPFELPRWPESLPDIAPPLALQADAMVVDRFKMTREGEPLLDIARARGGIDASDGALHLEHVVVDSNRGRFGAHGDYAPGDDFRMDLTASAVLPAPAGRTRPSLGLVARGDLSHLVVALAGNSPARVDARLVLDDDSGGERPHWTLRADSEALDPALLAGAGEAGTPIAFSLRASGVSGDMRAQGRYAQGDVSVVLQPSRLVLDDQVLAVQPLVLDLLGGRVTARGHVDLHQTIAARREPDVDLELQARGLEWRGDGAGAAQVAGDADVRVAGSTDDWTATGSADLRRDGQRARLRFEGRGDRGQVAIRALHAAMPTGTLDASGQLRWSPALAWQADARLAGFDPGYLLPDWDGAVDGRVASRGSTRGDGGLDLHFDVHDLGGRLRGRPLDGHGTLAIRTPGPRGGQPSYEGDVALTLGNSRVQARGSIAQRLDVRASFAPLNLQDLVPDARGTLRGTLVLGGARNAPDVDADLAGSGLDWNGWRAGTLAAQGRLPWRGGSGRLAIEAGDVEVAGAAFDSLRADARGSVEHLQLEAEASGDVGSITLSGGTDRRGGRWNATVATLRLVPARGTAWTLQSPIQLAQAGGGWRIGGGCLAADDGGSLCARGGWPSPGLDIEGRGLPLALVAPYLPQRGDERPWVLHGEFALDAHLRAPGGRVLGHAQLVSAEGGLRNSRRSRSDLASYRDFRLQAEFDPQRIEATLGAVLNEDGRVDARIATGWDAYAPLSGELHVRTDELTWLELLSPDIVEPVGVLAGDITLGGTRGTPTLGGKARLTAFSAEIPALGIVPSGGDLRLDALPDGTARIAGLLRSGEGTLTVEGSLGWQDDDTPLVLAVRGKDFLAADTGELRAVVDPDVAIRHGPGQPLSVTGKVVVPSATIDLEGLDGTATVSDDVVILDPVDPEADAPALATPLELDLVLELGDDVLLNGFGLTGTLDGSLRVRAQPGSELRATGALEVGGRYRAYGQQIDITRGALVWNGDAIANPRLDLRAERRIGDVVAGIDVTGRASRPEARVWTNPPTDQSQALAYLALGRPLSSASGDESQRLDAASAALSAGGSLIASQLGAGLGLDDAGVMQSRALGGSVIGVGKYLSPRLYVSYGVSLLGTGHVLTLKYLLRAGFDIEIESSTRENRGSVNWRKER